MTAQILVVDDEPDMKALVNDQDLRRQAARSTRVSLSTQCYKVIGLVRSASAPLSSALRFVTASP